MARNHDWDVFGNESPTQIHHKDCRNTPDSHPTGDARAAAVENPSEYARKGESFDRSCKCLDPLLGEDRERETLFTCTRCGAPYTVGVGGDPFTTITVSYHDDEREDFAESFCPDCGDELLADVRAVVNGE